MTQTPEQTLELARAKRAARAAAEERIARRIVQALVDTDAFAEKMARAIKKELDRAPDET